jgi:hypothetical protein
MDAHVTFADQTAAHGFIPMNHVAPQFFPILEGPVYDDAGKKIPGHKRVYRDDTGDTLGMHTDSYTLVPYERHFEVFEHAIYASGLPTRELRVGTDMSDNGARIFRQYLFPETVNLLKDSKGIEHSIALCIVMFDSYNGTSAFVGKSGFFNFRCANQSYSGKSLLDIRFKHTGDMEGRVKVAAEQLTKAGTDFIAEFERLQRWTKIPMNATDVQSLADAIPQASKLLTNEFVARFGTEGGDTLWDFNQVLTSWATHNVPSKTRAARQKRVCDLVEGKDWRQVENA